MKNLLYIFLGILISLFLLDLFLREPAPDTTELKQLVEHENKLELNIEPQFSHSNIRAEVFQLFQSKEYHKALQRGEAALSQSISPSDRNWLQEQLPKILLALAWQKLQEGNCEEARKHFEQIISRKPLPLAFKGLGTCSFIAKDFWSASNYLRRYLNNNFDFDAFLLQLESLESLAQFEDAAALLEDYQSHGKLTAKQEDELSKRKASMAAKLKESEYQSYLEGRYANLYFRPNQHQELSLWLMDHIDQGALDISEALHIPPPKQPLEIYLYPQKNFSNFHSGPSWAQGVFDGRIRIPVPPNLDDRVRSNLVKVVRHELSHALMAEASNRAPIPTWFQEGVAQIMECPGGCRGFTYPATPGNLLAEGQLSESFNRLNKQQAQVAYRQSLFLIHSLKYLAGSQSLASCVEALRGKKLRSNEFITGCSDSNFKTFYQKASQLWQKRYEF